MSMIICGSVGVLLSSGVSYRWLTRAFDWGPADT